jgi:hypothetical protein
MSSSLSTPPSSANHDEVGLYGCSETFNHVSLFEPLTVTVTSKVTKILLQVLFRTKRVPPNPQHTQALETYTTMMHDLRKSEKEMLQKRSRIIMMEGELLVHELLRASERVEDWEDCSDLVRMAFRPPGHPLRDPVDLTSLASCNPVVTPAFAGLPRVKREEVIKEAVARLLETKLQRSELQELAHEANEEESAPTTASG